MWALPEEQEEDVSSVCWRLSFGNIGNLCLAGGRRKKSYGDREGEENRKTRMLYATKEIESLKKAFWARVLIVSVVMEAYFLGVGRFSTYTRPFEPSE